MADGRRIATVTQSIIDSGLFGQDAITPLYWCPVPPRGGFSIPNLQISVATHSNDAIPFQRAGWYEVAGFLISSTVPLVSNFQNTTAEQLVAQYVHKIKAPDFDVTSPGLDEDERVATVAETIGPDSEVAEQTREGTNPTSNLLLSHPGVYDQARELNLGATRVYHYSSNLGTPFGKGMPVDENTQIYVDDFNVSLNMMRTSAMYNFFVLVASMPQLGASHFSDRVEGVTTDPGKEMLGRGLAPFRDYPQFIQMMNRLPFHWLDSMDETDPENLGSPLKFNSDGTPNYDAIENHQFREFLMWKRWYNVPADSWHNSTMRWWTKGDAVMTYPVELWKTNF